MPRRTTVAELRDRIDGLALAFFASMAAVCTTLIEVHPDGATIIESMRDKALAMLATLDDLDQEVFPPEAIGQAFTAVVAAFVTRREPKASNDNEDE